VVEGPRDSPTRQTWWLSTGVSAGERGAAELDERASPVVDLSAGKRLEEVWGAGYPDPSILRARVRDLYLMPAGRDEVTGLPSITPPEAFEVDGRGALDTSRPCATRRKAVGKVRVAQTTSGRTPMRHGGARNRPSTRSSRRRAG